MSNAIISIAARMTSTRLPGKTLAPVLPAWPLLQAIAYRLAASRAELIVIATSDQYSDLPIVQAGPGQASRIVTGSADDLMLRHMQVARDTDADYILLAGADDPFLDHRLFDMVLDRLEQGDVAYVKTAGWPLGMNVWGWTRQAMEEGNELATAADEREHVVPYWERRPSRYPAAVIHRPNKSEWVADGDLYDKYRLTIDNQSDLDLTRAIYGILGRIDASAEEVIAVLEKYPSIAEMNRDGLHGTAARDAIYSVAPVDGSDVVSKVRRHIATERLAAKASIAERGDFAQGQDMALLSVDQWLDAAFR